MARYHGKKGLIYLSTTGAGAATSQANLSAWSLSFATDKVEVTAFQDTNKVYVQGLKDVSGSFSGFFDDVTTATLFTAADSADGVKLYLYPSSDALGRYFYGPAWVDVSVDTSVFAAVTVSGSISANGAWGFKLA